MNLELLITAITHTVYGHLRQATHWVASDERIDGDRGAVSLEQVLWFVAAGVAVAVIAGIIWSKIKTEAEKPVNAPSAP
ncbi:MAG TPA: hypothetical protein PKV27_02290 [Ilumatobacteraceae bacterium]|nr:hypothetical protein [Ilumatobacteraceae bacterium]